MLIIGNRKNSKDSKEMSLRLEGLELLDNLSAIIHTGNVVRDLLRQVNKLKELDNSEYIAESVDYLEIIFCELTKELITAKTRIAQIKDSGIDLELN